ncbi:hypothetical protein M9H77_05619 [Catharanthus roseus]|uniref:Uncharacterized protein n=1 Tax=Catharanthus roseus TaxID=4058 RepID=A0ACC0CHM4_CATRO|nr:hypothetical protein M9H77_05619 [Catharanthus roseus]
MSNYTFYIGIVREINVLKRYTRDREGARAKAFDSSFCKKNSLFCLFQVSIDFKFSFFSLAGIRIEDVNHDSQYFVDWRPGTGAQKESLPTLEMLKFSYCRCQDLNLSSWYQFCSPRTN